MAGRQTEKDVAIDKFILENPHLSNKEIGERLGCHRKAISARRQRLNAAGHDAAYHKPQKLEQVKVPKREEVGKEARMEAQMRNIQRSHQATEKKYRVLQDDLRKAQKARDTALGVMAYEPKIYKIKKVDRRGGQATAFALLSDVHCEEVVPAAKVNYLNEHNPDISKRRVTTFFALLLKFIRVDREETTVNNLVLWLGGDFFTNDAHGAPVDFGPSVAVMYAQDMVASGVQFLVSNEPNLQIHIVGSVGNHSRAQIAKPVNQALEQEGSWEWMMYHNLKNRFKSAKNVTWQLDNSYNSYLDCYGKTVRFNHGHLGWRWNDGLAGLHGPVWKCITQKWDKQIKADLTCFGHYHTYTPAATARPYIGNGSTIGASPYGIQVGYEPPSQAYFLIHDKYGIVGQRPLFVDS